MKCLKNWSGGGKYMLLHSWIEKAHLTPTYPFYNSTFLFDKYKDSQRYRLRVCLYFTKIERIQI